MDKSSTSSTSSSGQGGKNEAIVEQAKHAVTFVADQAKESVSKEVNSQFGARKDQAVETMGNVADAIRGTGEKLKGVGPLGDVAERAAAGLENVAGFFEGKQLGDIVRDVERFARREPALFLGATFALGLIGGRFLKSSSHRGGGGSDAASARQGGFQYDRESAYDGTYADEYGSDFLSDNDFHGEDSVRFGTYGSAASSSSSQYRGPSNTLPYGSRGGSSGPTTARTGSTSTGTTTAPMGAQASPATATPPLTSSYAASSPSPTTTSPSTTTSPTTTSPSTTTTSPTTTSPSTSPSALGSKGGNTPGSV